MKQICRIVCVLLCCVVLAGCGKTAPATEATMDPVESFLNMAQGFVDQKDYDGAIAVLKQALETVDDPRLHAMLEEVKALWGTP